MPKQTESKQRKGLQKISEVVASKRGAWYLHESFIVIGIILFILVIVQLAYPTDRTLPFTKVADIEIGSLTKREAIQYLFNNYGSVQLTVTIGDTSIKTTTDKAGVLVDFQKAADAAARYPWWQRLIPLSLFYKAAVINAKPEVSLDDQLAKQFAADVKRQCDRAASEASVAINGADVVLKQATDGRNCTDTAITQGLAAALFRHGSATTAIQPNIIRPHKTTQVATSQLQRAKSMIATNVMISVADKMVSVPKQTIASWIVFSDDPAKGVFEVTLNDEAIRSYLQSLKSNIYIEPVPVYVHVLDGNETSRDEGKPGRDFDYDSMVKQIKQMLSTGKVAIISAQTTAVQPSLQYLYNYSQSQRGLEKLLADIAASKGNYAISVIELSGMGRVASVNGGRKYVTASTYKLFVAYMVLKDLESGGLKWDDVITDGLNVRQCFEEMIVRSANRCAIAYIARYGAGNIVNKMHELGFASVEHNSTWWATVSDMALYMKRLERGELLQGESRDFLLGLLKRQVWRYGIPTGIPSVTIADKVGFLEDYIHDLAIVYSPKGTYILAIMTKGGSYGGMADVARRVHRYMMEN
jgi:beta-lactamase class A